MAGRYDKPLTFGWYWQINQCHLMVRRWVRRVIWRFLWDESSLNIDG